MLLILEECRWLYNHFLEQRQTSYRETGKSPNLYDQNKTLPILKSSRETLNSVHSQVLQNVALRVDLAFKSFFRRVKSGEKPGYPRFRGSGRYSSFCYPQYPYGCHVNQKNVYLSKVGNVRLVLHRPLEGSVKTVSVKLYPSGKWFLIVSCVLEDAQKETAPCNEVGIDVGLSAFATLSDGSSIDNPRFFRKDEKQLTRAQRRRSKSPIASPAMVVRKKVVSRIYERISNRRLNFAHQNSRRLVNLYSTIAVEDLNINRMTKNRRLAKSIMDAAWSQFAQFLSYKAEWAGRKFIAVNPAYTSQDCSRCGYRQVMLLSDRKYNCPNCGLSLDRDHNAALNILARGLASIGNQSVEAAPFTVAE